MRDAEDSVQDVGGACKEAFEFSGSDRRRKAGNGTYLIFLCGMDFVVVAYTLISLFFHIGVGRDWCFFFFYKFGLYFGLICFSAYDTIRRHTIFIV